MVDYSENKHCKLNEYWEIYMYQRSKSFFDLCPRSLISFIQKVFCLKIPDRLKSVYILSLHETRGPKFFETGDVTLRRWLPCRYMVRTFKNLLLQSRTADDLETWYAALGIGVLPNSFK